MSCSTSSNKEDDDITENDNESDKSPDENIPDLERDTTISRKKKCESSI